MPEVSTIIPVYNQERYLREAIDSVLAQTYHDREILVVDDGSTDATPEIIGSYGPRIRAFRKANGGGASALNLGIRQANGRWIGWLSSDDLWEPSKLARQMEALREMPDAGLIYTDVILIDADGRQHERQSFPCPPTQQERLVQMARRCFINGSSVLIRRDVFDHVGLFDERDRLTPDYDLWLKIVRDYNILHVPEALVRYRVHPGQTSARREAMEHSSRRVASRALRRMRPTLGAWCAALRIKDQLAVLPWQVKQSGGGFSFSSRIRALADAAKALTNPEAP
jgi:glycosyltransferase involved in cell wall biosynthesis